ncbi:hypothetical protein [Pseudophaeobacter sp.]|uniref:hypothetical protein n=1 Tax=Pseudophaeobacter sp. TaxID=1971739 RepID=UPI00329A6395
MLNRTAFFCLLTTSFASFGLAPSASANETAHPLPFTYETFETAVPHIDLEACPAALPQVDSFCRATVHHEEIHVFAFSYEGDSPMVGFASYSAEGLDTLFD